MKTYILDTNVLLYDHTCLFNFEDNNIILPILVLEELDKHKKGNTSTSLSAREISRTLDRLPKLTIPNKGIALSLDRKRRKKSDIPTTSLLFIAIEGYEPKLPENIYADTVDNKILALAYNLTKQNNTSKDNEYILVTKDINLRMKAWALGIQAQDYETGKIKDISDLYIGHRTIEDIPEDIITELYESTSVPQSMLTAYIQEPIANEYFVLRNHKLSALATYNKSDKLYHLIESTPVANIAPKNAEQTFAIAALTNPNISLVTLTGKSGTGKSLLSLASAIEQKKYFKQIYLYKPIATVGKALGFLPGSLEEKLDPHTDSFKDSLEVIKSRIKDKEKDRDKFTEELIKSKKIVMAAMPYIRGRSLPNIFIYVDEVQSLTPHEVKTIITRAGEKTKVVLSGDIYQIDNPYLDSQSNGLTYLIDKMKGQEIYAHINLLKGERSHLSELASNLL